MGTLLAIILGVLVTFSGDVNRVEGKEVDKKIEDKKINKNENKIKFEDMQAYKSISKKLPSYNAEELLCKLADSALDTKKYNNLLDSLKDTDIKLSGKVSRVRNNFIDGCYIVFTQKRADSLMDGWGVITCYIYDDDQIEKAMKLEKGDNITLSGHCSKYPLTGISLYDCYLK